MNFQDLILRLERFWADYGCLIQQPYDVEVGAGTFNPATLIESPGTRALESGLCRTFPPAHGRPVRRKSQPAPALLSIPGHPQTVPHGRTGRLPGKPAIPGHRSPGPRHPFRGRRLGIAHSGRLGPWMGGVAGRHGDNPIHLFPAGGRLRPQSHVRGNHLWSGTNLPCICSRLTMFTILRGTMR